MWPNMGVLLIGSATALILIAIGVRLRDPNHWVHHPINRAKEKYPRIWHETTGQLMVSIGAGLGFAWVVGTLQVNAVLAATHMAGNDLSTASLELLGFCFLIAFIGALIWRFGEKGDTQLRQEVRDIVPKVDEMLTKRFGGTPDTPTAKTPGLGEVSETGSVTTGSAAPKTASPTSVTLEDEAQSGPGEPPGSPAVALDLDPGHDDRDAPE